MPQPADNPRMTRAEAARHASLVRWKKESALTPQAGGMANPKIAARVKEILAEKAKAKGKGKGKGKAKAAKPKDARTPQEKKNQNRAAIAKQSGMGDLEGPLVRIAAGMSSNLEPDAYNKLIEKGLAQRAADGTTTLTSAGKKWKAAADKGDVDGAMGALGEGRSAVANKQGKEKEKADKAQARDAAQKQKATEREQKQKERVVKQAQAQAERAKLKQAAEKQKKAKAKEKAGAANEKANAKDAARAETTQAVDKAGIPSADLHDFARGGVLNEDAAGPLEKSGLIERGDDGTPRLTAEGRTVARSIDAGDTRGALDALSRAGEKKRKQATGKAMTLEIKAGARHSRMDSEHLDAAAVHIHAAGGKCPDCPTDEEGDDMEDVSKAIKAMTDDPKYYAVHECGDMMSAAAALSNLCILMQSELAEDDEDATDVSQLCDACRILVKFIESEIDECEGAAGNASDTVGHEGMPMKAIVSGDDATARKFLARAVARHKRHMSGTEPTDEASQQQLMDEMQSALKAIAKRDDVNPKEGEQEYGDVQFADARNKKYPIDTEAHVRAAWNYINKEDNAAKYDPAEVKQIKSRIVSAWKKLIDDAGPPSAGKAADDDWLHIDGGAIKAFEDDTIKGLAVLYGTKATPDLERDYYDKDTDLWLDHWGWPRPITYHHGIDKSTRDDPVIGHWTKATVTDEGVWLEGQLDRAHRYYKAIKQLAERGYLKISSDSGPQWVIREPQSNGANYLKRWPLVTASVTVTPMEPRMLPVEVKAFLADLGLEGIDNDNQEAIDPDAARADELKAANDERLRALSLELDLLELETTL